MASIVDNVIGQVQIGNGDATRLAASAYGVCNTAANEETKVVEMTGFTLITGISINVKFTYANTHNSPRLYVGTSGGFPIKRYDANDGGVGSSILTTSWPAGAIVHFTFDGTNWVMNFGVNTDTTYTVQSTYDDTDTTNPISGAGVKAAIQTLDKNNITGFGPGKTLDTLTETDGIIGATFQDIQIGESQVTNLNTDLAAKAPINNPSFTGTVTLPSGGPQSDNEAATKKYVDDKTAGFTGAMHYIDAPNVVFTVTEVTPTVQNPDPLPTVTVSGSFPTGYTPAAGDIIVYNHQEFVYTGSAWRLLGDEGSYALKTKTAQVVEDVTISHTRPSLTVTPKSIPNVTNAGSVPSLTHTEFNIKSVTADSVPTTAKVENGTLKITIGSASTSETKEVSDISAWNAGSIPTLGTAIEVGSASNWDAGSQAAIATKPLKTVVIP